MKLHRTRTLVSVRLWSLVTALALLALVAPVDAEAGRIGGVGGFRYTVEGEGGDGYTDTSGSSGAEGVTIIGPGTAEQEDLVRRQELSQPPLLIIWLQRFLTVIQFR